MKRLTEWDFVVVGGGTAGCVVAARLSQRGYRVLLLEAGGPYRWPLSVPLAGMRLSTHYSWRYQTAPQTALGGRRLSLPFGKVLGGSSSTNAMMMFRGSPGCYDRWDQLGCTGWNYASVLPYFKRAECWEDGHSEVHGGEGPVHVSRPRHLAPFSRAFVQACLERGLPLADDFNAGQTGAGYFAVMQRDGRRASAAPAYLAVASPSLTVETGVLVHRVVLEKQRALGVEYLCSSGETRWALCAREIILCAGALNTPKLLMLSGIGPALHLERLGIAVQSNLPAVGANLQDHVRIPMLFRSGQTSPGAKRYWMSAALGYALQRRGVLASNCCEAGAVLSSSTQLDIPDLQFVTHFQSHLHPLAVDLQFCVVRIASRGDLRLSGADPIAAPIIDPRYLAHPDDLSAAVAGIRLARQIADAPALRRFPVKEELVPGTQFQTDRELESHCRATAETCYHPAGTCRMGSDESAVVDPLLRLRGFDNVRIADASVIPELPNGNTCAIVLMIAERAADLIGQAAAR